MKELADGNHSRKHYSLAIEFTGRVFKRMKLQISREIERLGKGGRAPDPALTCWHK